MTIQISSFFMPASSINTKKELKLDAVVHRTIVSSHTVLVVVHFENLIARCCQVHRFVFANSFEAWKAKADSPSLLACLADSTTMGGRLGEIRCLDFPNLYALLFTMKRREIQRVSTKQQNQPESLDVPFFLPVKPDITFKLISDIVLAGLTRNNMLVQAG